MTRRRNPSTVRVRRFRGRLALASTIPVLHPRHERMPIAVEQIERLRRQATTEGDRFFARVCERAKAGDEMAINACKAAVYGLA